MKLLFALLFTITSAHAFFPGFTYSPGNDRWKTCYYGFTQSGGSLASPTECTSGTCGEVVDTCGSATPPAWNTTALYTALTWAAGTWANSSVISCSCSAWDVSISDPKQCRMYFFTADETWSTDASGGYETNIMTTSEAGTQETAYVLVKCTGVSP